MRHKLISLFAIIFVMVMLLGGCSEQNGVELNTNEDTGVEQTALKTVECSVDATRGEKVVYDAGGFYVEYRGIIYDRGDIQVSLYVENNTDIALYCTVEECLINRSSMSVGNSSFKVLSDSNYLIGPNFNFVIDEEDLIAYGIDTINTVYCELMVWEEEYLGEEYILLPITITDNVSIG